MTSNKPVMHAYKVRVGQKPPAGQVDFVAEKAYGAVGENQEDAVRTVEELAPGDWTIIEGSAEEIPVPKGWVAGKIYHVGDAE